MRNLDDAFFERPVGLAASRKYGSGPQQVRRSIKAVVAAGALGVLTSTFSISSNATVITATGTGGIVPENNAGGATFSLTIADSGLIDNLTLDLFDFVRNGTSFRPPSGGIVELIMRLSHVDTGTTATIINHPLNAANFICIAGLNGDYTFDSGSASTLNQACGTGNVNNQPLVIAPGTFAPVSNLSTVFDGEDVAGTWNLFVSDTTVGTGAGQFVTNSDWTWGLNVTTTVPEPATFALMGLGLAGIGYRRHRSKKAA